MFLLRVLFFAIEIYVWLIVIRVIVSFLPIYNLTSPWRRVMRVLYDLTEPLLSNIRRFLPRNQIGLDFSPFIAVFLLTVLKFILRRLLI